MNTNEIANIIDGYGRLTRAVEKAVDADKSLVDEADQWVAHLFWAADIQSLEVNVVDQTLIGFGTVWTVQTGGSHEQVNFTIPLETLRKFL